MTLWPPELFLSAAYACPLAADRPEKWNGYWSSAGREGKHPPQCTKIALPPTVSFQPRRKPTIKGIYGAVGDVSASRVQDHLFDLETRAA